MTKLPHHTHWNYWQALLLQFCSAQQKQELSVVMVFALYFAYLFLIVLNLRNPNLMSTHMNFTRQCALRHIWTMLPICGQIWVVLQSLSSQNSSWFQIAFTVITGEEDRNDYNLSRTQLGHGLYNLVAQPASSLENQTEILILNQTRSWHQWWG